MTLIHQNATTHGSGDRPHDTLTSYFARYRFALYLLSGAGIVAGVAMNWNWLAAAGLLPILAFLPCMLMMFMCMRHGTRRSDQEKALQHKALPPRFPTSSDPQR